MNGPSLATFTTGTMSFSAGEPEELAERGRDLSWSSDYVAMGRAFRADVAAAQIPCAQILRIRFCAPSIARGETPPDSYVFAMPRAVRGRARLGGENLGPSQVGIFRPGREYEFHTTAPAEFLLLSANRERVEAMSVARWGRSIEEARGLSVWHSRDARRIRTLLSTCLTRLDQALRSPGGFANPRFARELARDLEVTLVDELLASLRPREGPTPIRREAARRAEAYLRASWRQPIRLADLCEAAGAPDRTLRQGFEELYGRSPMSYLRLLRHRAARAMLKRPDAGRISDTALSCGFTHFGDFSVGYRRLFGETPSCTRRAARAIHRNRSSPIRGSDPVHACARPQARIRPAAP